MRGKKKIFNKARQVSTIWREIAIPNEYVLLNTPNEILKSHMDIFVSLRLEKDPTKIIYQGKATFQLATSMVPFKYTMQTISWQVDGEPLYVSFMPSGVADGELRKLFKYDWCILKIYSRKK